MTTKDYLIAARAKITDEGNWTQYALARDANSTKLLDGCDPLACRWCAMGAVQAVTPVEHEYKAFAALNVAARKAYPAGSISTVNDCLGHAAVLACFDQAIKDSE